MNPFTQPAPLVPDSAFTRSLVARPLAVVQTGWPQPLARAVLDIPRYEFGHPWLGSVLVTDAVPSSYFGFVWTTVSGGMREREVSKVLLIWC